MVLRGSCCGCEIQKSWILVFERQMMILLLRYNYVNGIAWLEVLCEGEETEGVITRL